ncbi:BON domain-containing protein [Usitatibacter palustris]|uniref:BON domain-containing protein n=1 Tax=Usitatibacter palustris TaxID=2732487 RepID=A0A6M4H417_9PROT|nr:BON domain-containing protein [Usitatibacter palustris]QJR13443.1 hypothetical protein DSM104440_00226 [Usitatibacter palustris]
MKKNLLKTIVFATGVSLAGFAAAGPGHWRQADPVRYQSESDLILQENVKAALYADKKLENSIFNVTALDGRVSITGTLDSQEQAAEVKRVAQRVDGSRSITTFLEAPVG